MGRSESCDAIVRGNWTLETGTVPSDHKQPHHRGITTTEDVGRGRVEGGGGGGRGG